MGIFKKKIKFANYLKAEKIVPYDFLQKFAKILKFSIACTLKNLPEK